MRIQSATESDFSDFVRLNSLIQAIHAEAEPTIFKSGAVLSRDEYLQILANPEQAVFVCFEDAKITPSRARDPNDPASPFAVGYVFCEIWDQKEGPYTFAAKALYLRQIYVHESARGRGIGKCLLDEARRFGLTRGATRVELDTWSFNTQALALFRRAGFKTIKERLAAPLGSNCANPGSPG